MRAILAISLVSVSTSLALSAEPGYYRQPTIRGNTIVFVAEGDLWSVPLAGGNAIRLTTHPGAEGRPALSPDGKTLAFAAHFDGEDEVYIMPATGGPTRRLTYDGGKISHVGWTPSGKVLVGTDAYSGLPSEQLVVLDYSASDNAMTRFAVPLAQAADGSYSPDSKTLYFTRLAAQHSHTKRYKGGTAQQLWSYREGDAEAKPLTADYPGTSKAPMFWDGRVYFASDRDGTMNLWSIKPDGTDPKEHTKHAGFDIASPALSEGKIVYQLGADLWLFDIASGTDKLIPIKLESDFDQTREKWIKLPLEFLETANISPDGTKVVATSRGRVFVLPRHGGRLVEAGRKSGVRYRNAQFMPDGKSLLAFSDESGEVELWTLPADGVGASIKLTSDSVVLRREALPSPDGKYIVHTDMNHCIYLLEMKTKENKKLSQSIYSEFEDLAWSPDSKWFAFSEYGENHFRRIMLYSLAAGKIAPVTTDRFNNFSPTFSIDGKWLYFLSDRNLKSVVKRPWGSYQPEPFFDKMTKIYQLPLVTGVHSPFSPPTELEPAESDEKRRDVRTNPRTIPKKPSATVNVELDGIAARLAELPIPPGNFRSLVATDKALFWFAHNAGEEKVGAVQGIAIGHEDHEVKTIAEGITGFALSADGRKLLLVQEKEILIANAALEGPDNKKARVNTLGWFFSVDPREEWRQMFTDAWRLERDYFYDRGMHGLDWPAVKRKYEPLLPRVKDRDELDDLIGQMVSELSALHTFVKPGDVRKGPDVILPGRLGAAFERDTQANGFRVARIYQHDPDEPELASPLARPEVAMKAGDIILSVDGESALAATDIGQLLRHKSGRQVLLSIKPAGGAPRNVIVKPINPKEDEDLRYHEWEYTRRLETEKLSGGDIGYVHLRAMVADDIDAWAKGYYPVFNKSGLIIDVRNNHGGNIDSWIVGRLLRKAWYYWNQRVGRRNEWNMQYAFRGYVAVLCNETTASDGESFSEATKRLKLGTLIGTRTWGGSIWLSQKNDLADRGIATAAEFGVYDQNGNWLIEGYGVDPDFVVDNLPHATFEGKDAQLAAAITLLKDKIKKAPIVMPPVPPFPKK